MPTIRPSRLIAGVAAIVLSLTAFTACEPGPPDTYVALGDSYTSGPQISNQTGAPAGCLRSDHNYASVAHDRMVSDGVAFQRFWDLSCSGAQTKDMYADQSTADGTNIAQLLALGSATKVVTIGIGGNDIGFSDILQSCLKVVPALEADCKPDYVVNGVDELRNRVDALAPKIAELTEAARERAPQAEVFIVGYPTILPNTGQGCWPAVPISGSDVAYLYGVEAYLNAMLETQADAHDVTFVDVATSSIGHDACAGSSKWTNGISLSGDGAMFHPNAAGMAHTGDLVAAAIEAELAQPAE